MRYVSCLLALLGLCAISAASQQPHIEVLTWGGNTPTWNRDLHLTGVRVGCSGSLAQCINEVNTIASQQGVHNVFLAIFLHPGRTPNEAAQYSQYSVTHPVLYEVGFDDFVSQCEKLENNPVRVSSLLLEVARNLKSANPHLHLGITVYEDQLTSPRFPLSQLNPEFRQQVDFVHLYSHYRQEAQPFLSSVRIAKQLFPSAVIIAGVYAYDRRDYLPCAAGSSAHCTKEQELALFEQSFREQMSLLRNGTIGGIEFYPGDFGRITQWDGWQQPRICQASRRSQCVETTEAMRDFVRSFLARWFREGN